MKAVDRHAAPRPAGLPFDRASPRGAWQTSALPAPAALAARPAERSGPAEWTGCAAGAAGRLLTLARPPVRLRSLPSKLWTLLVGNVGVDAALCNGEAHAVLAAGVLTASTFPGRCCRTFLGGGTSPSVVEEEAQLGVLEGIALC